MCGCLFKYYNNNCFVAGVVAFLNGVTRNDIVLFCQSCVKKLEGGSLRLLPSPSKVQQRITEIEQQKEELKIEVSRTLRRLSTGV